MYTTWRWVRACMCRALHVRLLDSATAVCHLCFVCKYIHMHTCVCVCVCVTACVCVCVRARVRVRVCVFCCGPCTTGGGIHLPKRASYRQNN